MAENQRVTRAMRVRTFGRQTDTLWVSAGDGSSFRGTPTLLTMEDDDRAEIRVIDPGNPEVVHVYHVQLSYERSVT